MNVDVAPRDFRQALDQCLSITVPRALVGTEELATATEDVDAQAHSGFHSAPILLGPAVAQPAPPEIGV